VALSESARVLALATWVGDQLQALAAANTGETTLVLGADVSNSTVTPVNITGLAVLLPAGLWEVRAGLLISTAAVTTGPQVGLAWPAGPVVAARIETPSAAAASVLGFARVTGDRAANTGLPVAAAAYLATIDATVRTAAPIASPGLRPTLQSEVAGSAVTVKADSWLSYRRLA
jgi:hypothetical protein